MDFAESIDVYSICGEWICSHVLDLRDGEEKNGNHSYTFAYDGTASISVIDRPWQDATPGQWQFDGRMLQLTLCAGMTLKYYYAIERLSDDELVIDQLAGIAPTPDERFVRNVLVRQSI